jgi:hypothetical protein
MGTSTTTKELTKILWAMCIPKGMLTKVIAPMVIMILYI